MSGTANSGKHSPVIRFDADGSVVFGSFDFEAGSVVFDGFGAAKVSRTKTTETVDGKEVNRTLVSAALEDSGKCLPAPKDLRTLVSSLSAIAREHKANAGTVRVNDSLSKSLVRMEKLRDELSKLHADVTAIDASIAALRLQIGASAAADVAAEIEADEDADEVDETEETDESDETDA